MRLTACLPTDLLARLRAALPAGYRLTAVESWVAVRHALERAEADVVVVDPRRASDAAGLGGGSGTVPVIVYTAFTPSAIRLALSIGGAGVRDIILQDMDDSPCQLRQTVDRIAATLMGERVLALLEPRLAHISPEAADAIRQAVRRPTAFRDVAELCAAVNVPSQTLRRWLRRVGLASPRVLLTTARGAWAYHHIRQRTAPIKVIAGRAGYERPRDLAKHVRVLMGRSAMALRHTTPEELLALLSRHLLLEPQGPEPPATLLAPTLRTREARSALR